MLTAAAAQVRGAAAGRGHTLAHAATRAMAAAAALRVATAGARAPGPAPRGRSRTCSRVPARAAADTEAAARERYARENNKGFHQARYAAEAARPKAKPLEGVQVRPANGDSELAAAAWMRARAFYVYPPERAFAGQRQQEQKAESELKRLREETAERVPQKAYAVLVAAVPCEVSVRAACEPPFSCASVVPRPSSLVSAFLTPTRARTAVGLGSRGGGGAARGALCYRQ